MFNSRDIQELIEKIRNNIDYDASVAELTEKASANWSAKDALGEMYLEQNIKGHTEEESLELAKKWFEDAILDDWPWGHLHLAEMYIHGDVKGVSEKTANAKALSLLNKATKLRFCPPRVMYYIAYLYFEDKVQGLSKKESMVQGLCNIVRLTEVDNPFYLDEAVLLLAKQYYMGELNVAIKDDELVDITPQEAKQIAFNLYSTLYRKEKSKHAAYYLLNFIITDFSDVQFNNYDMSEIKEWCDLSLDFNEAINFIKTYKRMRTENQVTSLEFDNMIARLMRITENSYDTMTHKDLKAQYHDIMSKDNTSPLPKLEENYDQSTAESSEPKEALVQTLVTREHSPKKDRRRSWEAPMAALMSKVNEQEATIILLTDSRQSEIAKLRAELAATNAKASKGFQKYQQALANRTDLPAGINKDMLATVLAHTRSVIDKKIAEIQESANEAISIAELAMREAQNAVLASRAECDELRTKLSELERKQVRAAADIIEMDMKFHFLENVACSTQKFKQETIQDILLYNTDTQADAKRDSQKSDSSGESRQSFVATEYFFRHLISKVNRDQLVLKILTSKKISANQNKTQLALSCISSGAGNILGITGAVFAGTTGMVNMWESKVRQQRFVATNTNVVNIKAADELGYFLAQTILSYRGDEFHRLSKDQVSTITQVCSDAIRKHLKLLPKINKANHDCDVSEIIEGILKNKKTYFKSLLKDDDMFLCVDILDSEGNFVEPKLATKNWLLEKLNEYTHSSPEALMRTRVIKEEINGNSADVEAKKPKRRASFLTRQ